MEDPSLFFCHCLSSFASFEILTINSSLKMKGYQVLSDTQNNAKYKVVTKWEISE